MREASLTPPKPRSNKLAIALALVLATVAGLSLYTYGRKTAPAAPVRMAYLQNDLHHLPLWVAMARGFYRDEGVDVKVAGVFRSGPEIMTAFGAGELDAAFVGEAPVTLAVARGAAQVQVLAQANTEGSALVVSFAWKPGEDKERTVAIPGNGSVQDLLLRKALARSDLAAEKVKTIVLAPPDMLTALQSGQIDGFVAWEPYPSRAQAMGIGRVLHASADIWQGHPCCVLAASDDFVRVHPKEVQGMVRAQERAIRFIAEHQAEAVAIAVKHTGMDEAVVRSAMGHVTYTSAPSVAGEEEYVRFLGSIGYIKAEDPVALTKRILGAAQQEAVK